MLNANIGPAYSEIVSAKKNAEDAVRTHFKLGKNSFVLAALGATGALDLVVSYVEATSKNKKALVPLPEYHRALGRLKCNLNVSHVRGDNSSIVASMKQLNPAIMYLSYPNNPTGNLYELNKIVKNLPVSTLLVIDTTLFGMHDKRLLLPTETAPSILRMAGKKNVVIVGSLSKTHGPNAVALRFGWILTNNGKIHDDLFARSLMYPPVSTLRKGTLLLKKTHDVLTVSRALKSHRILQTTFPSGPVEYVKGDTMIPYCMLRVEDKSLRKVITALSKADIIVAKGAQVGIPDNYLRIEAAEPKVVKQIARIIASAAWS
ncbi:MAG: aminotransferase class I/II-fold pyridoxal phosphate-dependent enzyme [Candidatus Woesearchaeota archaeon]